MKHISNSDVYQRQAMTFRMPESDNLAYPLFGVLEEIGELIEKTPIIYKHSPSGLLSRLILRMLCWQGKSLGRWAKRIRKGKCNPPFFIYPTAIGHEKKHELDKELGDIHWMVVALDDQYGSATSDVNTINIDKLSNRKRTDTIITHKDH